MCTCTPQVAQKREVGREGKTQSRRKGTLGSSHRQPPGKAPGTRRRDRERRKGEEDKRDLLSSTLESSQATPAIGPADRMEGAHHADGKLSLRVAHACLGRLSVQATEPGRLLSSHRQGQRADRGRVCGEMGVSPSPQRGASSPRPAGHWVRMVSPLLSPGLKVVQRPGVNGGPAHVPPSSGNPQGDDQAP